MSELAQKIDRYQRYLDADRAGLLDRAALAYRSSLELEPQSAVASGRLAAVEISKQNFTGAEEILQRLIGAGERDPALLFNLALALYYQRRFEEALARFEPLTEIEQVAVDARYHVLSCLHNLLREEEAIARGEAFLAQSPAPKVRGYLALILLDAQRAPEAYEAARQTLRDEPDNTDAAAVLATHELEQQRVEDADRLLQLVLTREPTNIRAWQGLALGALHRREHEVAIEHLQRAIAIDPQNLASHITLGWVQLTRHDYASAERAFRAGIESDRNEAELHGGLASALVFQHEFDEAKREIALALRLDRHSFGALFARSILLRLSGKDDLATKLVAQILQRSMRPDAPTPLDSLLAYWRRNSQSAPARRRGARHEH